MSDPHNLQRFLDAQAPVYAAVTAELQAGRKTSHWMWFIFPQLAGLGRSERARFFAIADLTEARAYLAHPALGARLTACTGWVNAVEGRDAHAIFGSPDDLKFHSSMTLFHAAAIDPAIFQAALDKYFRGVPDRATLALLR
nr:DUF1810 domain-containing protein [uncultured Dongia sp.]